MESINFVARENDSRLYQKTTLQLGERPLKELIAPKWEASHYAEKDTPFNRDHLIGIFLVPTLLTKTGIFKDHSVYISSLVYRIISLYLLYLIGLHFLPKKTAIWFLFLSQLTPIGLNYQLRANHEQLLIPLFLLSIYSILKKNQSAYILSILGCFLTKGIVALPIAFTLQVFDYLRNKDIKSNILLGFKTLIGVGLIALIYEYAFRATTGHVFFEKYFEIQITNRSMIPNQELWPLKKLKNFIYYFSRLFSYTLPWSLIALLLIKKAKKEFLIFPSFSLIFISIFSLSDRLASRYIIVAIYAVIIFFLLTILNYFKDKIEVSTHKVEYLSLILFFGLLAISLFLSRNNFSLYG